MTKGTEAHIHLAGSVFCVTNAKNYSIPFVALNIFKVFHKERLIFRFVKKPFVLRVALSEIYYCVFNSCLLFFAKCNYPEGAIRMPLNVIQHKHYTFLGFSYIAVLTAAFIITVLNIDILDAHIRDLSNAVGESNQAILVDFSVRESNQVFVFAAIMPKQSPIWQYRCRFFQDRVRNNFAEIFFSGNIVIIIKIVGRCSKEVCRR